MIPALEPPSFVGFWPARLRFPGGGARAAAAPISAARGFVAVRRSGLPRTQEAPLVSCCSASAPTRPAPSSAPTSLRPGFWQPLGGWKPPPALTAGRAGGIVGPRRGCSPVGRAGRQRRRRAALFPARAGLRGRKGPARPSQPERARAAPRTGPGDERGGGAASLASGRAHGRFRAGATPLRARDRRLSHAPSPSPPFPPSLGAPGSTGGRPSFVCARGPGRPNFAAPARLPGGSREAWLGGGGAWGACGSPAGGRTKRAAPDNKLGGSTLRPLLGGARGGRCLRGSEAPPARRGRDARARCPGALRPLAALRP